MVDYKLIFEFLFELLKVAGVFLATVAGIVTSGLFLWTKFKILFKTLQAEELEPVKTELNDLKKKMNKVDKNTTKNFLSTVINDYENHIPVSETVKQRFWEEYDYYITPGCLSKKGENSYIKDGVDNLIKKGLIKR